LGLIEDTSKITTANFKDKGDVILLLGRNMGEIGGSEYLAVVYGLVAGEPPGIDLAAERAVQRVCLTAIGQGYVKSAHDCSEGGLAVALAEGCVLDRKHPIGANISVDYGGKREDFVLFGEDQSRIIITAEAADVAEILQTAAEHDVHCTAIGTVGGDSLVIGKSIRVPCGSLSEAYYGTIGRVMERKGIL